MPSVSPRRTEGDVLDGAHIRFAAGEDALFDREVLRQVVDLERVVARRS